jgi:hypothetical protein
VTTDLLEDPLAKFGKRMPVVEHARCINCHGRTKDDESLPPRYGDTPAKFLEPVEHHVGQGLADFRLFEGAKTRATRTIATRPKSSGLRPSRQRPSS